MYQYTFCQPKQGVFKVDQNHFEIITEYGLRISVNYNKLLIYLFSEEMSNATDVHNNVQKYEATFNLSLQEIENTLDEFLEYHILQYGPLQKVLHRHYSFNPAKILNYAQSECNKRFISLGKLELAVTAKCPFNCTYCSKKIHSSQSELSLAEKKRVILDASELGAQTVSLTGGEPLHNEIVHETLELIEYAHELNYRRIVLLTSGYNIDKYSERIVSSHLNEVQISYNMIGKFAEDRIRNQYIEKNITNICSIMDYGIRLGVCCVLTSENIKHIPEIVEFCLKHNLYSIYFYPVMPVGYAQNVWNEIRLSAAELNQALQLIKSLRAQYKNILYISAPQSFMQDERPLQICEGGLYMLYITESGDTSACACSSPSGLNVRDHKLSWVWQEADYFDTYRTVKSPNQVCNSCDDYATCINSCIHRERLAISNYKFQSNRCNLINDDISSEDFINQK